MTSYSTFGAVFAAAFSYRGWAMVLLVFGLTTWIVVISAFFKTSYLKIGGRIYAARSADRRPDVPDQP